MTVNKITTPPTPQAQIDKINEIIDNLGGSGGGGLAYSATCPAITITDGVATWAVTHNLGTQDVVATLYNVSTGAEIEKNVVVTSNNGIIVTFKASSNVSAGDYKIVVMAGGASSNVNTWVFSYNSIYSNVSLNTGIYSIDISSYLPNDGAQYEVQAIMAAYNTCNFMVGSDLKGDQGGIWLMNSSQSIRNSAIIVVGSGRTIEVRVDEAIVGRLWLELEGYKKVG